MQDVFVFDAPLERFSAWWGCFVHGFEGEKVAQKENVVEGHSVDGCGRKEVVDCCACCGSKAREGARLERGALPLLVATVAALTGAEVTAASSLAHGQAPQLTTDERDRRWESSSSASNSTDLDFAAIDKRY